MHAEQVIRKPILFTEKSAEQREELNKVTFEVAPSANKIQIRAAVESLFGVKVVSVRTQVVRGKFRRMGKGHGKLHNWKKAVVTLKEGDDIQFFDEDAE